MSWRDKYQIGSFRGVQFATQASVLTGGRRGELHEFPDRDEPWFEDLGRLARGFDIDAIYSGPDYMADRDRLIAALEARGPGELIHPYYGLKTVAVISFEVEESTREGGLARFVIRMAETAAPPPPRLGLDTAELAIAYADTAALQAEIDFPKEFSVADLPAFVEEAAAELTRGFAEITGEIGRALAPIGDAVRAFEDTLQVINRTAIDLVRAPAALAATITRSVNLVRNFGLPLPRLSGLRAIFSSLRSRDPVIGDTPARRRQRANQQAFDDLAAIAVGAEIVRAAAKASFASYDEAIAVRDEIAAEFDAAAVAAADAGRDAQLERLEGLRRALVRDVTARGGSLARLYAYTPLSTQPALLIAHRLYGDSRVTIERADEIVLRNRIAHPGFLAGGRVLEVRTDG